MSIRKLVAAASVDRKCSFCHSPDSTTCFHPEAIRAQFPILSRHFDGRELVYLDSAATTQKPRVVIDAITRYYEFYNANIHRGAYRLSEEATAAYEGAREKVRVFLNARGPEEIVFTRGTTESINLVAYAWGRANITAGDEILVTEMEHHSDIVPWQILAKEKGATVKYIPVGTDGMLDMRRAEELLTKRTKVVGVVHVSNVLGTVNPVRRIAEMAHAAGARVLVDASQSAPHMPVDVRDLGCDFLAMSGHKMCAPTGIGVLYARRELLDAMPPFHGGGDMIRRVTLEESTWNDLPWKFEAGTPNIAGAIGLGVAVDFLRGIGLPAICEHSTALTKYAVRRMREIPGVTLYGPSENRIAVISFNIAGVHPHDIATIVDSEESVAVRAGHLCAQPLMDRLGVPALVRASIYLYNTQEDIDRLVTGLEKARKVFRMP